MIVAGNDPLDYLTYANSANRSSGSYSLGY